MSEHSTGRLNNVLLNTLWAGISQTATALMGLISRKIFLRALGDELMGANSLFADVLGLFSFAELGFGVAITFFLYRPIAEGNKEKVRSLLAFYRQVYWLVIGVLVLISVGFYPFLAYLKTDIPPADLRVYYAIYQIGNILGYLCAFRESYVSAIQRERELTKLSTAFSLGTTVAQICVVLLGGSFLTYLLTGLALSLLRKATVNVIILRRYPETDVRGAEKLPAAEREGIYRKVKALLVHRMANLCISQTDSLIISYMIGVVQWGFVSHYLVLRNTIAAVLNRIYSAVLPSMGNLVAKESRDKQLDIFRLYDFINFWMYGFCFVALACLSSPFVELFFGTYRVLDRLTVFLLFLAFYLGGLRDPVAVLREACGAYDRDKRFTVYAAVVNLATSVLFVKLWGLPGVFLGTICSMLVFLLTRPVPLFHDRYGVSARPYFARLAGYILAALAGYGTTEAVCVLIRTGLGVSVFSFAVMTAAAALVPNAVWCLLYWKDPCFQSAWRLVVNKVKGIRA